MANNVGDTRKVLSLAISAALSNDNLPDGSPLKVKYKFGDSILLTSDSVDLELLPTTVDTFTFKILTKKQICDMLTEDIHYQSVPHYLYLRELSKTDSGYYVSLLSLGCIPFGGGGALGLYINWNGDSFEVKDMHASSIN